MLPKRSLMVYEEEKGMHEDWSTIGEIGDCLERDWSDWGGFGE